MKRNDIKNSGSYFYEAKPIVDQWKVAILRRASLVSNIAKIYYNDLFGYFTAEFMLKLVISKLFSKSLTKSLELFVFNLCTDNIDKDVNGDFYTQEALSLKMLRTK